MTATISIKAFVLAAAAALVGAMAPSVAASKTVREPTVSTVGFSKVIDAPICKKVNERVYIPPHWVTALYRGKATRVLVPGQTRVVPVLRCHLRVVTRRVNVGGHWITQRVVLHPYVVEENSENVSYGTAATVSGTLRTNTGSPVGRQPVEIWTAPDNGLHQFSETTTAVTSANGTWSAVLPAGPSRLVVSVYRGAPTLGPSISRAAHLLVAASMNIAIAPRSTHWGGTVTITGRLRGGYVPPSGELVVIWVGYPGGSTEITHAYSGLDGVFRARYTFRRGSGLHTYELWAATVAESDYPYTPNRSPKVAVTVNP